MATLSASISDRSVLTFRRPRRHTQPCLAPPPLLLPPPPPPLLLLIPPVTLLRVRQSNDLACVAHRGGSRTAENVNTARRASSRAIPGTISRLAGNPFRPTHKGVETSDAWVKRGRGTGGNRSGKAKGGGGLMWNRKKRMNLV